jgi:hypothetical protein
MDRQHPGVLADASDHPSAHVTDASPAPSARAIQDDLPAEGGSWLLLVPAGTCLVLVLAALLGFA